MCTAAQNVYSICAPWQLPGPVGCPVCCTSCVCSSPATGLMPCSRVQSFYPTADHLKHTFVTARCYILNNICKHSCIQLLARWVRTKLQIPDCGVCHVTLVWIMEDQWDPVRQGGLHGPHFSTAGWDQEFRVGKAPGLHPVEMLARIAKFEVKPGEK